MRIRKGEKTQWEMFFAKVDKNGPVPSHCPELGRCWVWTGSKRKTGHGYFAFDGRIDSAYRFTFLFRDTEVPSGFDVMHRCDNPACVNPDHLELGTHGKNIRDAVARGQIPTGERCSWTKLTEVQVTQIRLLKPTRTLLSLAKEFGVSESAISKIVLHEIWKHI